MIPAELVLIPVFMGSVSFAMMLLFFMVGKLSFDAEDPIWY